MSISKKLSSVQAGGAGEYVEDVFSTYLYTGNGSTQTITNGIDLAGEGGLVWIKRREIGYHVVSDTERGFNYKLHPNTANSNLYDNNAITSFNSDGFAVGADADTGASGGNYASWTFRKAPKFFDVVTYTGNGSSQEIPHNLGTAPGVVIVKNLAQAVNWVVYHKDLATGHYLELNTTDASTLATNYFNSDAGDPTDAFFRVGGSSLTNSSGINYVAYLFAHNNGDGGFGENADQDIIKCGSYTGNGSSDGPEIDLGWEPQWLLVKRATNAANWLVFDTLRGWDTSATDYALLPDDASSELSGASVGGDFGEPIATGFKVRSTWTGLNGSGDTYIYIAIRRPHKPAETGSEVFDVDAYAGNSATRVIATGFPVDLSMFRIRNTGVGQTLVEDRLTGAGTRLFTDSTAAETSSTTTVTGYDLNTGVEIGSNGDLNSSGSNYVNWNFKRSPGFFDVVCTTGGSTPFTRSHNLGVAPEMIIAKARSSAFNWEVWHKDLSTGNGLHLNLIDAEDSSTVVGSVDPTDTTFDLTTTQSYISYLFASQAGISKVGSYTGDGNAQQLIDCGFTTGVRFVLIKRTDAIGYWQVYDSVRGITAGNDKTLYLDETWAEDEDDRIDPHASGFYVNAPTAANLNVSGATYIFLAIA